MRGELIFMGCAFKCDRCGKYYDKSTLETGPRLYKNKNTTVLDLCEECKESLTNWLASPMDKSKENETIERFILRRAFIRVQNGVATSFILVPHFIEALIKFFDFREEEEVEDFIGANASLTDRIEIKKVKECLAKYFDYEWKDAFYG